LLYKSESLMLLNCTNASI